MWGKFSDRTRRSSLRGRRIVILPGQYYDQETGLRYNYYRTYDPSTGRYLESDPVGLEGGLNTYGYAHQNPLLYTDRYGLDVDICYYPDGVTHVGYGLTTESTTFGFYPKKRFLQWPGEIREDPKDAEKECKTIDTDDEQDQCMLKCRAKRAANPGWYRIGDRQCTDFVRDCMRECGIPTGIDRKFDVWQGPRPDKFFKTLPGEPRKGKEQSPSESAP